jgi:hypothetical protein
MIMILFVEIIEIFCYGLQYVTTPNAHIPDGPESSGITAKPSGIRIPDASRQESAVRNKSSGKLLIPDGARQNCYSRRQLLTEQGSHTDKHS